MVTVRVQHYDLMDAHKNQVEQTKIRTMPREGSMKEKTRKEDRK